MATIVAPLPWYEKRIQKLERALFVQQQLTRLERQRAEFAEARRDRAWQILSRLARLTAMIEKRKIRGS
jgi:hypothetical protein